MDLPATAPAHPHSPAKLTPLVRWAGGKRWLIPLVGPGIHRYLVGSSGYYIEPFAGGAAMANWLGWPHTILGDTCEPLMVFYRETILHPGQVYYATEALRASGITAEAYYTIRAERPIALQTIGLAAWLLYMNRLGYNGLYRENKSGGYNVPYGKLAKPAFPTLERLIAWSQMADEWTVVQSSCSLQVGSATRGDVLFCDPPHLDGTKGSFTGYAAGGWTRKDRVHLAQALGEAAKRGVLVVATDGGSEEARMDYEQAGLQVLPVVARHQIGATGARRGQVKEWLIVSDVGVVQTAGVK